MGISSDSRLRSPFQSGLLGMAGRWGAANPAARPAGSLPGRWQPYDEAPHEPLVRGGLGAGGASASSPVDKAAG